MNNYVSQALVLLAVTSCLVTVTSSTKRSWSEWVGDDADNWNRRSCAITEQRCSTRVTCCHPSDICLGTHIARCTRMDSLRSKPAKGSGESCSSSSQCEDGCCREFAQHRVGIFYRCDTPRNKYHAHKCV